MAAGQPKSCLRKRGQPRRLSAPEHAVVSAKIVEAQVPAHVACAADEAGPARRSVDACGGWRASWQADATALLKYDVKAFARGVLDDANSLRGHTRPWAVRGEAYQDLSRSCSCVSLVQCGVRMRLPMKIFAHNFVELSHGSTKLSICADAAGALRRWAVLSLELVNDKRAGRPAWSGWSSSGRSAGADLPESIVQREEWDWTYRTDYAPCARRSGGGEHDRTRESWEAFLPLGSRRPAEQAGDERAGEALGPPLEWQDDEGDEPAGCPRQCEDGASAWLQAAGEVIEQMQAKLFEDFLDELGLASCTARLVLRERGWELRLRWWAAVNPQDEALRGASHSRLRDTTLRFLHGDGFVTKEVEERQHVSTQHAGGAFASAEMLDADAVAPHMSLVEPRQPRQRLWLDPAASSGSQPPAAAVTPDAASTPAAPATFPVAVATCLAAGASAGGAAVVVGDAETGSIVVHDGGRTSWCSEAAHDGLTGLALCPAGAAAPGLGAGPAPSEAEGAPGGGRGGALVLSAGSDGHVRGWQAFDGAAAGCCLITGAVKADSERRGLCVVQCVAAADGRALAAAAAGRSVFSLSVTSADGSDGRLALGPSGQPRPPLPSAVTALSFGGSAGSACLAAATTSGGVFVWRAAQLADAAGPHSLHLHCSSSFLSLSLAGPEDNLLCCAGSTDCTLRLWHLQAGEDPPARDRRPMTFGGIGSKARSFDALVGGAPDAPAVLALADGAAGAVAWRLRGARLGGDGALGVDMRRGERLPPPAGRYVLAVALGLCGERGCLLACSHDDGSARVFRLACATAAAGAVDEAWQPALTFSAPAPAAPVSTGRPPGARSSGLVALREGWLYAAGADGELRAWALPRASPPA